MNTFLLKTEQLTKRFGSNIVLNQVSLEIPAGCILGLVGENGAGKSTFVKCVTGIYKPDGGSVCLGGNVSMIPQEFNLAQDLSVCENIFLGREPSRFGVINRKKMAADSAALLRRLSAEISPYGSVAELNVAEKQMVEIAKALSVQSKLLIMDEPTTVLNSRETAILFQVMRELKNEGCSIIFISHRLDEICEICDDVAVLRDGSLVHRCAASELDPEKIARLMVGRELTRLFPEQISVQNGEIALECAGISSGKEVSDISFSLIRGSVTGIAGLAGAGRTELAEAICGLRKRNAGTIKVSGKNVSIRKPADSIKNRIVYLTEDRQASGLLPDFSVTRNTTLASLIKYCTAGFIHSGKETLSALEYIREFGIKTASPDAPVSSLSGGNQQKVAIAKCLDNAPEIFIFDEPTRGVDVGARREIYDFIASLAKAGMTCLIISSDLDEIIGMCPRILVMRSGKLAGELNGAEITQENIMYLATGVKK
ncbi:MAG: sugar ABC transporter ATP-binding protein [Lentisphaeria bacterium]|nr:sugar ABC transporter ATP-binding protein [Lentisphaeria bacterium]